MASKGLGVVYEKCSKEQKDELVSILVETLTTGKRCVLSTDQNIFTPRWPYILEKKTYKFFRINPEFGILK